MRLDGQRVRVALANEPPGDPGATEDDQREEQVVEADPNDSGGEAQSAAGRRCAGPAMGRDAVDSDQPRDELRVRRRRRADGERLENERSHYHDCDCKGCAPAPGEWQRHQQPGGHVDRLRGREVVAGRPEVLQYEGRDPKRQDSVARERMTIDQSARRVEPVHRA
jgi:hypothetical protein